MGSTRNKYVSLFLHQLNDSEFNKFLDELDKEVGKYNPAVHSSPFLRQITITGSENTLKQSLRSAQELFSKMFPKKGNLRHYTNARQTILPEPGAWSAGKSELDEDYQPEYLSQ